MFSDGVPYVQLSSSAPSMNHFGILVYIDIVETLIVVLNEFGHALSKVVPHALEWLFFETLWYRRMGTCNLQ